LNSLGVTAERTRRQVVRIVGSGTDPATGQMPFIPRARNVFPRANPRAVERQSVLPRTELMAGFGWKHAFRKGASALSRVSLLHGSFPDCHDLAQTSSPGRSAGPP
jgi:hypothetical protein